MDDKQKLQLQKMISENNVEDQTELIRKLKHSAIMKNEINNMLFLTAKYVDDPEKIHLECMNECNFLFTYYTDIYNKLRKDEIDVDILNQFLDILEQIEEGELDQHEGSFKVGTLLKKLYVDSALRKAEKLDEENSENKSPEPQKPLLDISWKQFKKMNK